MKKSVVVGIIVVVAVLIIGIYNYLPTGKAVLSESVVVHENVEKSVGYGGIIYTISSVTVVNEDKAAFQITSDHTSVIQVIETDEKKYHVLDPEIGKARVYVEDIVYKYPDGDYVKVRLEPLEQSIIEGIKQGWD